MKAGAERLDVTSEELAALVEGARATLGETGLPEAAGGDPNSGLCD